MILQVQKQLRKCYFNELIVELDYRDQSTSCNMEDKPDIGQLVISYDWSRFDFVF